MYMWANMSNDYYSRTHRVKVCREICAEAGYSGDEFYECVRECVSSKEPEAFPAS